MRHAFMTAAAAILALAVGASALQPVTRGYQNGKQCAQGSGCLTKPTVTECLVCCTMWCNYSGFLADCQNACIGGGGDPGAMTIAAVADTALRLQHNDMPQSDIPGAVNLIELAMNSTDGRVAHFARIVGGETPFVKLPEQHEVPGLEG